MNRCRLFSLRFFAGERIILLILSLIAASQILLCWRADVLALAIPSSLAWIFGISMLEDWLKQKPTAWRPPVPAMQGLGSIMILWCFNVLSFSSQFYDPLQQLLPLVGLNGVGLMLWGRRQQHLSLRITAYAIMVPLQVWGVPYLPEAVYNWMGMITARGAALLLALVGQWGATEANTLMLSQRVLVVTGTCTGLSVMALCLTTVLYFQWSFRLFSANRLLFTLMTTGLICGAVNSIRVAIIASTSRSCDGIDHLFYCQLNFWHDGLGSILFSLASLSLTCWLIISVDRLRMPASWRRR